VILLWYPLVTFGSLYLLWIFYLAVMNLDRARRAKTLSKPALWFGYPILIVGLLVDLVCNILLTVPFLDLPRETTVTYRLKRYAAGPDGWRKRVTLWFADDMLDDFDPTGKHV
jgi:amino acid transporter